MQKILKVFEVKANDRISAGLLELMIVKKESEPAVPADHSVKLKESEKKDNYIDLDREVKKIWNMKVTMIPSVIEAFGTVTKCLVHAVVDLEITRRVETIQITAL